MIETDALKVKGIRHGFFTREGGHSHGIFASLNCGLGSGDDRETVHRNRALVADALGVEEDRLLTAYQAHSPTAIEVAAPWNTEGRPKADGLVTAVPGIAIGVLTADCAPILFADAEARVVGAAHAGWKGALSGIGETTVAAMERLGAQRRRIVAAIGPTISQQAYEVGPEFVARFLDADPGYAHYFSASHRKGHGYFDLAAYLGDRLRGQGLASVVDLRLCTFSDEQRFFSYRRTSHRAEGDYGRQISAIALS
jgi:YfiH family protein